MSSSSQARRRRQLRLVVPKRPQVTVVGAGITGLTIAHTLACRGWDVKVVHRDPLLQTTSRNAAGLIEPVASDDPRLVGWFAESYRRWNELALTRPESGVGLHSVEIFSPVVETPPDWVAVVDNYDEILPELLPPAYRGGSGYRFRTSVVQTADFLRWFSTELVKLGVRFERRDIKDRSELVGVADLVVDATGSASRTLFDDRQIEGWRGDILVLSRPPRFNLVRADWSAFRYVISQNDYVIAGGTCAPKFKSDPRFWDRTPDWSIADEILVGCVELVPELAGLPILEYRVDMRPYRARVRVELEMLEGRQALIHCVGSGGSGWTIAWGLAEEVMRLIDENWGLAPALVA
jgi:D-amino-acid oxidase